MKAEKEGRRTSEGDVLRGGNQPVGGAAGGGAEHGGNADANHSVLKKDERVKECIFKKKEIKMQVACRFFLIGN